MLRVQLWGTRGSITTPGEATSRYGGNTSCVELTYSEHVEPGSAIERDSSHLILDAGSALDDQQAVQMKGPCAQGQGEVHFFLSHYHWDHLMGLPFYTPMFIAGNRIHFYGSSVDDLQSAINRLFTSCYSPSEDSLQAEFEYHAVEPEGMDVADFHVIATQVCHSSIAFSFRVQCGPTSVVYTPDHEVGDAETDAALIDSARDADVWILNANFTEEEKKSRSGWGHSSHIEATQLALKAGVKTAVLTHHNPDHDDAMLDQMGEEAKELAAGSQTMVRMARDKMVIDIDRS